MPKKIPSWFHFTTIRTIQMRKGRFIFKQLLSFNMNHATYFLLFSFWFIFSSAVNRQGLAINNKFPLTSFGGFQSLISVNLKYFHGLESWLTEDRGKNKNPSFIFFNFATLKFILYLCFDKRTNEIESFYHFYNSLLCCVHSICACTHRLTLVRAHSLLCSVLSNLACGYDNNVQVLVFQIWKVF